MSYAYLASPYSHKDPKVCQHRYEEICRIAAALMDRGEVIFSPIAHSHPIEMIGQPKKPSHDFWMKQDRPLLQHASRLIVAMLPGWQDSKGVAEEIDIAKKLHMPIEFLPV